MKPIIISTPEFVNLVTGARLIDSHKPKLEVEKYTLEQWSFMADVIDPQKAVAVYLPSVFRNIPNIGSLRFEEVKRGGGIQ